VFYVSNLQNLTATARWQQQQAEVPYATISSNSSKRILILVSDYKPPNSRLEDLLRQYQQDFQAWQQLHPQDQFDFYFFMYPKFFKKSDTGL
jgi:hypothetical protein